MGKSNPFKVGDRVYVYPHGWGEVMNPGSSDIEIDIDKGSPIYAEPSRVSFTEYDPIKGGLSHERPSDNSVWSPVQSMTLDAIGEKLQEHDRILKGVSGDIDELKKVKVDGKIKLADIWPIRPDFNKRFVSGGATNECVLSKDQSRYRRLIKDFMSDFDVVGFNTYDELYEAKNKDGSLSPGVPTGRVTLSIDLARRK